jgi:hypothetical protein
VRAANPSAVSARIVPATSASVSGLGDQVDGLLATGDEGSAVIPVVTSGADGAGSCTIPVEISDGGTAGSVAVMPLDTSDGVTGVTEGAPTPTPVLTSDGVTAEAAVRPVLTSDATCVTAGAVVVPPPSLPP